MRLVSKTVNWAATISLVAALIAAIALGGAIVAGFKPAVVKTGSMEPMLDRGTLILVKPTMASELKVGDVITFTDPDRPARGLVTHRIVKRAVDKGQPVFTTQGDANPSPDPWRLKLKKDAGRMQLHVPAVGQLSFLVRTKQGYLLLFGIPVLLLAMIAIVRIWTPQAEAPESGVPQPAGSQDEPRPWLPPGVPPLIDRSALPPDPPAPELAPQEPPRVANLG